MVMKREPECMGSDWLKLESRSLSLSLLELTGTRGRLRLPNPILRTEELCCEVAVYEIACLTLNVDTAAQSPVCAVYVAVSQAVQSQALYGWWME